LKGKREGNHRDAHWEAHGVQGHEGYDHAHGAVDPSVASSERGIWALKLSFVGLFFR